VTLHELPAWVSGYCEGDEQKRLRISSLFEEGHYCTTDQYTACPVFQALHGLVAPDVAVGNSQ
jgi:hypothetical protein